MGQGTLWVENSNPYPYPYPGGPYPWPGGFCRPVTITNTDYLKCRTDRLLACFDFVKSSQKKTFTGQSFCVAMRQSSVTDQNYHLSQSIGCFKVKKLNPNSSLNSTPICPELGFKLGFNFEWTFLSWNFNPNSHPNFTSWTRVHHAIYLNYCTIKI